MNPYPKRQPREKYSGMWGRVSFVYHFKDKQTAIEEAQRKDDVWAAAFRIRGVREGYGMSELSDIEIDSWYQALRLANNRTVKQFIENETEIEVLQAILKREAQTGSPDRKRIGLLNKRIQELRS